MIAKARRRPCRQCAAPASASGGGRSAPARSWRARSRRPARHRSRRSGRARGRARRAHSRQSDPAGAAPAIAATPPTAPLRQATAAAVPCRNKQATPRGCPRYCRHRARDRDRARGSRPWSARARSRSRAPSGAALSPCCGAPRAARAAAPPAWSRSRRRSEDVRWLRTASSRAAPPADRRRDECGNVYPHRRTAHRRSADRRRRPSPATASGPRSSHKRAAGALPDRPRWSRNRGSCRAAAGQAKRPTTPRRQKPIAKISALARMRRILLRIISPP